MSSEAFPAEIYLLIAEALQTNNDETTKSGLAILNLALSSRSHYALISRWASPIAESDVATLQKVLADSGRYTRSQTFKSPLSVLCKRISGICAICADRSDQTEIFTGLQVCKACDGFYAPKISYCRFDKLYHINKGGSPAQLHNWADEAIIRDWCRYFFPHADGRQDRDRRDPLVCWRDILELIKLNYLVRIEDLPLEIREPWGGDENCHNGEDFGFFNKVEVGWRTDSQWQLILPWYQACLRWDPDLRGERRVNVSPSMSEMVLLREFRYRFDPLWRPKGTVESEMQEYIRIAKFWFPYWDQRPWRPCNFPLPPRPLHVHSHKRLEVSNRWRELEKYWILCAKLRKLCKLFPQALLSPEMWMSCMRNSVGQTIEVDSPFKHTPLKSKNPGSEGMNFMCIIRRYAMSLINGDVKLQYFQLDTETKVLESLPKPGKLTEVVTFAEGTLTIHQLRSDREGLDKFFQYQT